MLLVGLSNRQCQLAGKQEVAGVACFYGDCVAFGAESIDGLEEENLIVGNDTFDCLNKSCLK